MTDITGVHATAENILKAATDALKTMELEDGCNVIAVTMDNLPSCRHFSINFKKDILGPGAALESHGDNSYF